ncbi:MAG: hypothetical protein SGARI_001457, partial [Bacillariaceae sp.]
MKFSTAAATLVATATTAVSVFAKDNAKAPRERNAFKNSGGRSRRTKEASSNAGDSAATRALFEEFKNARLAGAGGKIGKENKKKLASSLLLQHSSSDSKNGDMVTKYYLNKFLNGNSTSSTTIPCTSGADAGILDGQTEAEASAATILSCPTGFYCVESSMECLPENSGIAPSPEDLDQEEGKERKLQTLGRDGLTLPQIGPQGGGPVIPDGFDPTDPTTWSTLESDALNGQGAFSTESVQGLGDDVTTSEYFYQCPEPDCPDNIDAPFFFLNCEGECACTAEDGPIIDGYDSRGGYSLGIVNCGDENSCATLEAAGVFANCEAEGACDHASFEYSIVDCALDIFPSFSLDDGVDAPCDGIELYRSLALCDSCSGNAEQSIVLCGECDGLDTVDGVLGCLTPGACDGTRSANDFVVCNSYGFGQTGGACDGLIMYEPAFLVCLGDNSCDGSVVICIENNGYGSLLGAPYSCNYNFAYYSDPTASQDVCKMCLLGQESCPSDDIDGPGFIGT